mmetsp:Transcript_18863/g.39250  ORF Transcript_18863/g.39250 Transcript_18863/m.39250 type:complete len:474 (+) Transcript_18863:41-1462(+)
MDSVASLDSWKPARTLKQPTSQFPKANAGVRLNTERHIGVNIEVERRGAPSLNMKVGGAGGGSTGGGDVPSPLSSNLNAFINSPPRSVKVSEKKVPNRFAPIPRQKPVRAKPNQPNVNQNYDGSTPWFPSAAPQAPGEPGSARIRRPSGGRTNRVASDKGQTESPVKTSKAPDNPVSPAHTRIFNEKGSTLYPKASMPSGAKRSDEEVEQRRKFNCCRQVMDILEKHDYKLKKTFNHVDEDRKSIRVRSNHTVKELTGVLQNLGAKVDESDVESAFGGGSSGITYSQLAAVSTDTVYPGQDNGHKDFFEPLKREGKRVGNGPGARHNGFQKGFLNHDMTPGDRKEFTFVEKSIIKEHKEPQRLFEGSDVLLHPREPIENIPKLESRRDTAPSPNPFVHWTEKTVDHKPKLGLGGGRKASGVMASKVTKDSMNDLVFHGKYDDMKPMPVSNLQYGSYNAPFANALNTPPIGGTW